MDTAGSWAEHFKEFTSSPTGFVQGHWPWLIVILIVLFMLSRFNNYMEVNGVNKAIYLTRGIVGFIIAFIIAPIVFLLVLNLYAWANGLSMFNMTFLWDWFKLTISTFYWLLKSIGMPRGEYIYDTSALIRLAWVIIPLSIIWLRVSVTNFWRLMLIPAIAGIMMLTAYKKAEPTFLDKHLPEKWQNFKVGDQKSATTKKLDEIERKTKGVDEEGNPIDLPPDAATELYRNNAHYFTITLFVLFAGALALGFFTKYKVLSLFLVAGCFGLFYLMNSASSSGPSTPTEIDMNSNFEYLLKEFEESYEKNGETVETYKTSVLIRQLLDQGNGKLPKNYCVDYSMYFYDLCHKKESPDPTSKKK